MPERLNGFRNKLIREKNKYSILGKNKVRAVESVVLNGRTLNCTSIVALNTLPNHSHDYDIRSIGDSS